MMKPIPTPQQLHQFLIADFDAGTLIWRERKPSDFGGKRPEHTCKCWNSRCAGKPAGEISGGKSEYRICRILGRNIRTHRVMWAMKNMRWPEGHIDHINHDRKDNRIDNLREVSAAENHKNRKLSPKNSSGINGVFYNADKKKWTARIKISGESIHLGHFDNIEDAARTRNEADRKYGFHENHGLDQI